MEHECRPVAAPQHKTVCGARNNVELSLIKLLAGAATTEYSGRQCLSLTMSGNVPMPHTFRALAIPTALSQILLRHLHVVAGHSSITALADCKEVDWVGGVQAFEVVLQRRRTSASCSIIVVRPIAGFMQQSAVGLDATI